MSAQRRIDAFFTLADRGLRIANVLFRENLFEDATLTFSRLLNGSHANWRVRPPGYVTVRTHT
jgi:hypothetical protein